MTAEIVILNWNGRDHLRTFLPSVVAAAPAGVGVTVADNGSTDDSAEVLAREFPTVRVVRLGRNYGFAEGYNRALREVDAECFVLLNSDVETPAGWLEPLLEVLEREPDVAAVAPKLRSWRDRASFEYAGAAGGYLDLLGYPFCRGRILRCVERDEGQYDDERDVFWVSGAAFCCRAEVFRELGGFDASFFAHMEEIDLCWRMRIAGRRVRIVPRSTVYHLGGGTLKAQSPAKVYFNHRNNLAMLFKCRRSMRSRHSPTWRRGAGGTSAPWAARGGGSCGIIANSPGPGAGFRRHAGHSPAPISIGVRSCCATSRGAGPSGG